MAEPAAEPSKPSATELDALLARLNKRQKKWLYLIAKRRLPKHVRQFVNRRFGHIEARLLEATSMDRDREMNALSKVPEGEHVWMPALWITELYTPTTLDGLLEGLPEMMARQKGMKRDFDIVQWVLSGRRGGEGSYYYLPVVYSKPPSPVIGDHIIDELPQRIKSVKIGIHALTPTVTAVNASFLIHDDHSQSLEKILNRNLSTRTRLHRDGGYSVSSVLPRKTEAASEWREAVRADAMRWLADRLPGFFHRTSPGQLPTFELLLTERHVAWSGETESNETRYWDSLLGIEKRPGYWKSEQIPTFHLRERAARGLFDEKRHLVTLAAQREAFLSAFHREYHGQPRIDYAVIVADEYITPLANRWALSALVDVVDEQLATLGDLVIGISRKRSARSLNKIQQELTEIGVDGKIVVSDILRFTEDARWNRDVLDFMFVDYGMTFKKDSASPESATKRPTHKKASLFTLLATARNNHITKRTGATTEPRETVERSTEKTTNLAESLRLGQLADGKRVVKIEADLRELLNISMNLQAAAENLRLQRRVAWLTVISLIVAVVAAWAAIAALKATNPAPAMPGQAAGTALMIPAPLPDPEDSLRMGRWH